MWESWLASLAQDCLFLKEDSAPWNYLVSYVLSISWMASEKF
jgi:hypothetical protein